MKPLAHLKVIELTHMVMGPAAGMVLADLGADVIKVEPLEGDKTRSLTGSGAGFFHAFNRNKRGITLDLKSEAGILQLKALIKGADILVENFKVGTLEKLGLGYEALKIENPRLIYCALKGFLAGKYENRTALDEVVQMMGGLAYMTGKSGAPTRAGASVNDILGGALAVVGILTAVENRHKTGEGVYIKAGLFECNMLLMASHMMQYSVTGLAAKPMPERLPAWAVYDVFETKDEAQVFIGLVTDSQWTKFCEQLNLTDLINNPLLTTNKSRVLARELFLPMLREIFLSMNKLEILALCEDLQLPFAPINAPHEMFADEHLQHAGAMLDIILDNGKSAKSPALPLEWNGKRFPLHRSPPKLGEHNSKV